MTNFSNKFNVNIPRCLPSASVFMSILFMAPLTMADPINAERLLMQIAKVHQCHIVTSAPQKGDSVARLETEFLLAVWCTKSLQESNPLYDIIIAVKDDEHDWVDCPNLIPISATHTPPLIDVKAAKINGKTESLDKYTYLANDSSAGMITGPESEMADEDGLYIGHWDAEQTIYCYDDKWLISEFH